jgi:hypothetical protein
VLLYSMPITRDTFELYFQELGAVFKACYGKDDDGAVHLALVGPQIAYSALKSAATRAKTWDRPGGVQLGLVAEIERLTTISYADPDGGGWKSIPFDTAKKREILDEDEVLEVLNSLVFFTAALKVAPRPLVETMLPVIGESLSWEFGSWSCTDFTDFYVKSMRADPPEPETPQKLSSIIA